MAPMKRLRPADNDQGDDSEESDVIGVETAQTNLRQDPVGLRPQESGRSYLPVPEEESSVVVRNFEC